MENTVNLRQSGRFTRPFYQLSYNGTTGSLITINRGNETLEPERRQELELGLNLGILKTVYILKEPIM